MSQDRRVEEVRRLQVRLEEQEERNKTLRDVNAELRRQLHRHESEKPILTRADGGTGKKVSEARPFALSKWIDDLFSRDT